MKTGAVIVCAGEGRRLGRRGKATLRLGRYPLFIYSLAAFRRIKQIKEIVLVLRRRDFPLARKLIKDKKVILAQGGRKRKQSVYNGLCALSEGVDYVLIHDGARPFVSKEIILQLLRELKKNEAVVCAIEARDTLKLAAGGFVKRTLNRDNIFLVQTPQAFKRRLILEAHKRYTKRRVFDDAGLVEAMGRKVKVIKGDSRNFKITYPEDILLAKAVLAGEAGRLKQKGVF